MNSTKLLPLPVYCVLRLPLHTDSTFQRAVRNYPECVRACVRACVRVCVRAFVNNMVEFVG